MAHNCCHGNPLDRCTGIAHSTFLCLLQCAAKLVFRRGCSSQPMAERFRLETTSGNMGWLSCGGRKRNAPPTPSLARGWLCIAICGQCWALTLNQFNLRPHRQQRASFRRDEHVNTAGEFHLVVVKVIIDLLPRDQVPQCCDVAHTYATSIQKKTPPGHKICRVMLKTNERRGASNVLFTILWFLKASPVVSSCPCSSWVSSRKSKVFLASCRAPLTSRLAT